MADPTSTSHTLRDAAAWLDSAADALDAGRHDMASAMTLSAYRCLDDAHPAVVTADGHVDREPQP